MPSVKMIYPACIAFFSEAMAEGWKTEIEQAIKDAGLALNNFKAIEEKGHGHGLDIRLEFSANEPTASMQPLADAISERLAAKIPYFMLDVHCEGKQAIFTEVFSRAQRPPDPQLSENLFRNVGELELSVRASNGLKELGIRTIADLVQKTEEELHTPTHRIGPKTLEEIRTILGEMGLSLGMRLNVKELERLRAQYS